MAKIFEDEVTVGPDHLVQVELPPEVTASRVKVTIESTQEPAQHGQRKPRVFSMKYQGKLNVPDSFFDPLSDEELKLWEGGDL